MLFVITLVLLMTLVIVSKNVRNCFGEKWRKFRYCQVCFLGATYPINIVSSGRSQAIKYNMGAKRIKTSIAKRTFKEKHYSLLFLTAT